MTASCKELSYPCFLDRSAEPPVIVPGNSVGAATRAGVVRRKGESDPSAPLPAPQSHQKNQTGLPRASAARRSRGNPLHVAAMILSVGSLNFLLEHSVWSVGTAQWR